MGGERVDADRLRFEAGHAIILKIIFEFRALEGLHGIASPAQEFILSLCVPCRPYGRGLAQEQINQFDIQRPGGVSKPVTGPGRPLIRRQILTHTFERAQCAGVGGARRAQVIALFQESPDLPLPAIERFRCRRQLRLMDGLARECERLFMLAHLGQEFARVAEGVGLPARVADPYPNGRRVAQ